MRAPDDYTPEEQAHWEEQAHREAAALAGCKWDGERERAEYHLECDREASMLREQERRMIASKEPKIVTQAREALEDIPYGTMDAGVLTAAKIMKARRIMEESLQQVHLPIHVMISNRMMFEMIATRWQKVLCWLRIMDRDELVERFYLEAGETEKEGDARRAR